MARKMKRSTSRFLSVLFHLVVLVCMVLLYDAGKGLATKLGFIEGAAKKASEASFVDFMEKEEQLSTEIDPALAKYIDKNGDGYVLRTDGPFPRHLKAIATEVTKFKDVRMAKRVGDQSVNTKLSSRMENVMEYEIAGGAVRFIKRQDLNQREKSPAERVERLKVIADAKEKGIESPADPDRIVGDLVGKAVQFSYQGGVWKAKPTGEFKTMAWGKSLEEDVAEILVNNGLRPKRSWFGKSRIPIGHKLKLAGSSLGIVFEDVAKGKLDMEFVAVEGVHGHPCAVFDVSGAIELEETIDDEGRNKAGEETVESGRIWFSLLYPVMLRAELEKIVSYETREGGKLVEQFQGKASSHTHIDWKAVTAKPKGAATKKKTGAAGK